MHDELTRARRPGGLEEVEIDQVDQSAAGGLHHSDMDDASRGGRSLFQQPADEPGFLLTSRNHLCFRRTDKIAVFWRICMSSAKKADQLD